jgi:hypothetical protein
MHRGRFAIKVCVYTYVNTSVRLYIYICVCVCVCVCVLTHPLDRSLNEADLKWVPHHHGTGHAEIMKGRRIG